VIARDAPDEPQRPHEAVAGLMAAAAMFAGAWALVETPARIAPVAIIVALVAAGMGGRHSRLAALSVAVCALWWFLGMTFAIATDRPLW
jgi:hypothetical protein